MKALLIDHDDSFTYNLRDWLNPVFSVEVRNHRDLEVASPKNFSDFRLIVLSPGPKSPNEYPHIQKFVNELEPSKKLLGVCLGMQIMNSCEGGKVIPYSPPLHGKTSELSVLDNDLAGFEKLKVARYHSLECEMPKSIFNVLAEANDDKKAMWMSHKTKSWLGFQFHPESFLTENSNSFLQYVKHWCEK
jgi:anthranilate synthase/aminodeoxychorismate synthase-like glutamine amidotransferase